MKLIIAEKPSVGMTIASVVGATKKQDGYIEGNGHIVSWCYGHLIGLEEPTYYIEEKQKWNLSDLPLIPNEWKFKLADDKGAKKQYRVLNSLMYRDDVDLIICSTDAGREGECIFRYVYNYAKCKKPVKRLWVSSLEESAIRKGLADMKDDSFYDNLFNSGLARAKADWLIGMNLTRGYSIKYNSFKPVLSIGRVQTPTLAMIVERFNQVKNFVAEIYYKIDLDTSKGFTASSVDKYETYKKAEIFLSSIGDTGKVSLYEENKKSKATPKLFDLTLLQRVCNSMYGYTAKETLDVAQKLYESKLITYPRTDSNFITDDMENTVKDLVDKLCGFNVFSSIKIDNPNTSKLVNNKKVSDHHALLPTEYLFKKGFNDLNTKEKNILYLICSRLLISVCEPYQYLSVKVKIQVNDKEYEAKGIKVLNKGFKSLEEKLGLVKEKEEELNIPKVKIGDSINILDKKISEHTTKPPQLYTDDTLLKAMEIAGNDDYDEDSNIEKKGIGTPATRSGILETLVKRDYIRREKKKIVPTNRGINLINIVPDYIKSAKLTADWESYLQFIEKGKYDLNKFMEDIEFLTRKLVNEIKDKKVETQSDDFKRELNIIGKCPFCGSDYIELKKLYKCVNEDCGSLVWKNMASKNIGKTIVKKLLKNGRADNIDGFISKKGSKFSASICFDKDRKIKFDF
ncbi:MAG: DNA topoisomerase 3 [Eubacterium sp.]|nr:DNA topoisomerase 3 [Eubacterium sp.]